jgi:hypothetical protein
LTYRKSFGSSFGFTGDSCGAPFLLLLLPPPFVFVFDVAVKAASVFFSDDDDDDGAGFFLAGFSGEFGAESWTSYFFFFFSAGVEKHWPMTRGGREEVGPRCLLSRSASDGRRKRPASARGGDRTRRDETRRDERKGERFLFARRPPRAVRTAGAKRTRRDDATICSGREETTRLSHTANFFFSGSANELRCVLYKSVSPISRFQHLIASPFN